MNRAIFITGLDFPAGSTRGSFAAMAAALSEYVPSFVAWDDPFTITPEADRLLVVGHSFGGHEAVKLCRRMQRQVDGLILLDAVHQIGPVSQMFSPAFEVPDNVRWPASIRRRCWGPPFSRGFDRAGFNRIVNLGHAEFPRHPLIIQMVRNWVADVIEKT